MKFTNGTWDVKEGIKVYPATEVSKLTILPPNQATDGSNSCSETLRALCTTRHIRHRGDTLNKPTITVELSSPGLAGLADVLELKASHFLGRSALKEPRFERFPDFTGSPPVNLTPRNGLKLSQADYIAMITSENLSARIDTRPDAFDISFISSAAGDSKSQILTSVGFNSLAWIIDSLHTGRSNDATYTTTTNEDPFHRPPLGPTGQIQAYMTLSFSVSPGETFYGLGERFGPFIKNGQTVDMWNEDGGTDSPIGYKNVPFIISSKGYGIFVDSPDVVSFEVQSERMDKVQISLPGETIRVLVINGPHPKHILELYTAITGRPPVPAPWTFGLWLTTSFLTSYDEKTVTSFLDGLRDREIPLSVFHFDCFWMKGHQWCDFEWDEEYFPDAPKFIERLHERGLKVCVWINSYIGQEPALFDEGDEKGYFIKKLDGRHVNFAVFDITWQTDRWQAGMAIVDFTNPAAKKWYQSHLAHLMEQGVDAFKTDFGERIPWDQVKLFDNSDARIHHNYYAQIYNQAVFEIMVEKRGIEQACLFARSATAGGQRFPVHWGGDCSTLWTGMAEALRGSLSLGLAGFGFSATDIGGFKAPGDRVIAPEPALYKRWIQWGLLASHSRLHGSTTYRVPWEIEPDSPESSQVLKTFVELKHRLMPYIMIAASEAHKTGVPILRAMFLEFPHDPTAWKLDLQYMFGSDLLVAPIFSATDDVTFYVPEGRWVGLLDGKERKGPAWFTETHGFSTLPLLIRDGAAIVLSIEEKSANYDLSRGFEVVINGKQSDTTIEVPQGKSKIVIQVKDGKAWARSEQGKMVSGKIKIL
ncbi:glycoside hydrolase family 31 protein [Ramaria rubella]|nr:glycoside hydrolase family 31 protein [Ramaria rubella]